MQKVDFHFDYTNYGSSEVIFDIEGERHKFEPTYLGQNPLTLLIYSLYKLKVLTDETDSAEEDTMAWKGEPECQTVVLVKEKDDLHIVIEHFSDTNSVDQNGIVTLSKGHIVIDVHTSFEDFKNTVCREALRVIRKYGIVGYCKCWNDACTEVPISGVLMLLNINTITDEDDLRYSKFVDEMNILIDKPQNE